MKSRPAIALVATPDFKTTHQEALRRFVFQHLYTLTCHFDVISTGRTHDEIAGFIDMDLHQLQRRKEDHLVAEDLGCELTHHALKRWRGSIRNHFIRKGNGVKGMIEIANELVQGRLDAVIQLSVENDTTVRAGSAALRREANVHDVPIASDIGTAHAFVEFWKSRLTALGPHETAMALFRERNVKSDHCAALRDGDRVLALIAHDGQKVAMSQFVMEHASDLRHFRHILATGHSGEVARKSLRGCGWKERDLQRIVLCNPGPKGGDVEIAAAVIHGLCRHVLFFQDPAISHPHEADIRLFEQAILAGIDVRLATNSESARILLGSLGLEHR